MKSNKVSIFNFGVLFAINLIGLVQDIMGKELYSKVVQTYWVDSWYTLPMHFTICIITLILFIKGE